MGFILPAIPDDATLEQLEDAGRAISAAVARLVAAGAGPGEPALCPRCGCERFVRKGGDADGAQRYLCRGCSRTLTARTMGPLSNSKLPPERWEAFASCVAARMPLRATAERAGVGLATAWFMRHRACEALARTPRAFSSGPGIEVQVDGALVAESAEGGHRSGFPLGRAPRRRGGRVSRRGVSGEQLNVVRGANDRGVAPGTAAATDGHGAYARLLPAMGARHEAFASGTPEANRRLALVNSLHSRLRALLARFRGVSSRRLPVYLAWFAWGEQTAAGAADIDRFLFARECEGRYSTTRQEAWAVPFTFMGYWGVSEVV